MRKLDNCDRKLVFARFVSLLFFLNKKTLDTGTCVIILRRLFITATYITTLITRFLKAFNTTRNTNRNVMTWRYDVNTRNVIFSNMNNLWLAVSRKLIGIFENGFSTIIKKMCTLQKCKKRKIENFVIKPGFPRAWPIWIARFFA